MGEGHVGLKLAQISGQSGSIPRMQGLQAQPTVFADDDRDLITFPKASPTQAISREPHSQAGAPAADRLLTLRPCIRGSALRSGRSQTAPQVLIKT